MGLLFLALIVGATRAGHADELLPSWDLDGVWITLGPVGSATRIEGEWTTGAGGELSVAWLREREIPALLGVTLGGIGYTERDGGRLWLEAEVALKEPLPIPVGLAVGSAAEVDRVDPPRFGAQATFWIFTGIVPYVRAGTVALAGDFVELGVMIKLPAIRFVL